MRNVKPRNGLTHAHVNFNQSENIRFRVGYGGRNTLVTNGGGITQKIRRAFYSVIKAPTVEEK